MMCMWITRKPSFSVRELLCLWAVLRSSSLMLITGLWQRFRLRLFVWEALESGGVLAWMLPDGNESIHTWQTTDRDSLSTVGISSHKAIVLNVAIKSGRCTCNKRKRKSYSTNAFKGCKAYLSRHWLALNYIGCWNFSWKVCNLECCLERNI